MTQHPDSPPSPPSVAVEVGTHGSSTINALSNAFVAALAELSPMTATQLGIGGLDDQLDDLSPTGLSAVDDLVVRTIDEISAAPSTGRLDDVAREVILERLVLQRDRFDSGWQHATLNVIDSPVQMVRMVFDITPTDTSDQQGVFAARMSAVPAALDGYQQSLRWAAARGRVSAVRQVTKCAEQCAAFGGANGPGFFTSTVERLEGASNRERLLEAARAAEQAYLDLGRFLTDELLPMAPAKDAVGAERYSLASREFLGATIDQQQTYAWGWDEFLAIEAEVREVAGRISPDADPHSAARILDADPAYLVHGKEGLQAWMQGLSDRALDDLGKASFDLPPPIRKLECRIAPPGGGVGAYYMPPSDDFSRPGRMWWSVEPDRESFSTWRETTVVYHEGVPGHHLQLATAVFQRERLNDFQRLLAGTSGHAEGWALYAERLVRELGYLDNDGDLLGMLDSQLFRAARVIVDIGMHLELQIPRGTGFHEGETWTPELGLEFLLARTLNEPAQCRDELDRYLGWPGQAPSYKVGERVWLLARDAARRRAGDGFDEEAFHTAALNLGGMGLEALALQLETL